jgi:hypothetical protein
MEIVVLFHISAALLRRVFCENSVFSYKLRFHQRFIMDLLSQAGTRSPFEMALPRNQFHYILERVHKFEFLRR